MDVDTIYKNVYSKKQKQSKRKKSYRQFKNRQKSKVTLMPKGVANFRPHYLQWNEMNALRGTAPTSLHITKSMVDAYYDPLIRKREADVIESMRASTTPRSVLTTGMRPSVTPSRADGSSGSGFKSFIRSDSSTSSSTSGSDSSSTLSSSSASSIESKRSSLASAASDKAAASELIGSGDFEKYNSIIHLFIAIDSYDFDEDVTNTLHKYLSAMREVSTQSGDYLRLFNQLTETLEEQKGQGDNNAARLLDTILQNESLNPAQSFSPENAMRPLTEIRQEDRYEQIVNSIASLLQAHEDNAGTATAIDPDTIESILHSRLNDLQQLQSEQATTSAITEQESIRHYTDRIHHLENELEKQEELESRNEETIKNLQQKIDENQAYRHTLLTTLAEKSDEVRDLHTQLQNLNEQEDQPQSSAMAAEIAARRAHLLGRLARATDETRIMSMTPDTYIQEITNALKTMRDSSLTENRLLNMTNTFDNKRMYNAMSNHFANLNHERMAALSTVKNELESIETHYNMTRQHKQAIQNIIESIDTVAEKNQEHFERSVTMRVSLTPRQASRVSPTTQQTPRQSPSFWTPSKTSESASYGTPRASSSNIGRSRTPYEKTTPHEEGETENPDVLLPEELEQNEEDVQNTQATREETDRYNTFLNERMPEALSDITESISTESTGQDTESASTSRPIFQQAEEEEEPATEPEQTPIHKNMPRVAKRVDESNILTGSRRRR